MQDSAIGSLEGRQADSETYQKPSGTIKPIAMTSATLYRRSVPWLIATSVVLLVSSFLVNTSSGGAGGYPGPIARPDIPGGGFDQIVPIGGSTTTVYFCGFLIGTPVTFEVNGTAVSGAASPDNNGCVQFLITVGGGPTQTFQTYGPNGPITLGPVNSTFGRNTVTARGTGGPGPYRGKRVGLSGYVTTPESPPPPPPPPTTTPPPTSTPVGPTSSTTTSTTQPGPTSTTTTRPSTTTTTRPSSNTTTTLRPFVPSQHHINHHDAASIGLAAGAAAAAAAGAAAAAAAGAAAAGVAGAASAAAAGASAAGVAGAAGTAGAAGAAGTAGAASSAGTAGAASADAAAASGTGSASSSAAAGGRSGRSGAAGAAEKDTQEGTKDEESEEDESEGNSFTKDTDGDQP